MTFRGVSLVVLAVLASQPLLGAEPVALPPKQDLLIFLLAGQSNMAGRGKPLEKEDQTPHPRVLLLDKERNWIPAVDPLHWDKPPVVGVGLGLSFAKRVAEALPDKTIGLVPAAFGGSSIGEWEEGSKHYTNALERTQAALRQGTLAGVLWHQGESDTAPERAELYRVKLDQLIDNLRTDLASPEAPIVVGALAESQKGAGADQVNAALRSLPERVRRTGWVETTGLKMSKDGIHFDAASYRELGRRYADAWLRLNPAR
jgi:hypothetical protein